MEPQLIEIRSRINDLTHEGKELSSSVQTKLQEISESSEGEHEQHHNYLRTFSESKSSSMNPESMLDILKASSAESEEKSDQIAEDFMSNSLSIDEFLEQFKPSRTEMHLRKLKADKMQELLRQGVNGPPPPMRNICPPGMPNFYGSPGSAPYPNMPQGGYPMMPMPPNYRSPF